MSDDLKLFVCAHAGRRISQRAEGWDNVSIYHDAKEAFREGEHVIQSNGRIQVEYGGIRYVFVKEGHRLILITYIKL